MTQNKPSMNPAAFWLAVVDARHARLFHGSRTPAGRLHVEETGKVEENWQEKEHHRPMSLTPHPDGHSYAGTGHVEEERAKRFAKAVAQWAGEEARQRKIERLHLFAPKHFLGVLRAELPATLHRIVQDESHDLGRLTAGEIAEHPAVKAIPGADERQALDARLRGKD
jgi:protein required for attachment to host cells